MKRGTYQLPSYDDSAGFLLSCLGPKTTGIQGAVIWVSAGEFASVGADLGPRLQVVVGEAISVEGLKTAVSVRLTRPPVVLGNLPRRVKRLVVTFVNANRDTLLGHWNGVLSTRETLDLLKGV